jgi:tripartite-type tricarboxylate transporter receptor subunit TctC
MRMAKLPAAGLHAAFVVLAAIVLAAIVLAAIAYAPAARAASYPDHPIKIVVPFAPGGGTDVIARTLADAMEKNLGQSVFIENKPGAGTIVGTEAVAASLPDGYTLVMATFAHAVNPSLKKSLPYDTFKDFAPIALIATSFNIVVVNPKLPVKSIAELIAYAKANPGKLSYGSYGIGTSAHLAGELFKNLAQVDLVHVPYKGSAPAITDLLGGQIEVMFTTVASVAPYIQSGQLRALAVTSAQRSKAFPDLPTVAEAGVPGYVAESWYGLFGRAGTPSDIVDKLNKAAQQAIRSDAFVRLQQTEGLTLVATPPDELDRYVRGEEVRWRKLVQSANIQDE